ncbi:ImpA family type VI secretion system protein [Fluviispira sanaruensis]|uniref:Type VI secretion system protein TssA n=1 Tax=Fluviispira sanaruensis TaxID=2493639 RepID=A0A4P2VT16_FLUSA|nr:type VI secretion system ImpA family N-terminal domain-containing protein [Fluviispira sanaruensis]BBH52465.1 type VI secretion system protein TssA [Fluviispira sanaruensis]
MNLEINNLVLPVNEEKPFGEYLKFHPKLIKLKDMRKANLESIFLDEGIWTKKNVLAPNWQASIEFCEEILKENSKDLLVCAYYAEAQAKVNGFQGLDIALKLMLYFCLNNWEDIFPPLENDNLELRLAPFHWLEVNLPLSIRCIPFQSDKEAVVILDWEKYDNFLKENMSDNISHKNEFRTILELESEEYIVDLHERLKSIVYSLEKLEDFIIELAEKCNEKTSFDALISLCTDISNFIESFINDKQEPTISTQEYTEQKFQTYADLKQDDFNNSFERSQSDIRIDQNIDSIEDAYALIEKANLYLLKHNSHSPSPFLIRRALEWQKKSLYEVFMELFATTSKPSEIFTLLGLSKTDK